MVSQFIFFPMPVLAFCPNYQIVSSTCDFCPSCCSLLEGPIGAILMVGAFLIATVSYGLRYFRRANGSGWIALVALTLSFLISIYRAMASCPA